MGEWKKRKFTKNKERERGRKLGKSVSGKVGDGKDLTPRQWPAQMLGTFRLT